MEIDRDYLIKTLRRLVQINSVNPSLGGGPGEEEIGAYVARNLHNCGLHVEVFEKRPGRPSVVATLKGRGEGRSLMFNAHYDTVGVEGMKDPFSAEVRDGRIYGRGAYDMKGSLAACMAAGRALVRSRELLAGDLVITAVADEEYASLGTVEVLSEVTTDGAIVTEPTALEICLAHKGFIWTRVETKGRAAHGSQFDVGVDANRHMGAFLMELDRLNESLTSQEGHPLVGPASLHAAKIKGGSGLSTYAARCLLEVERRTIPGETAGKVEREFQQIVDKIRGSRPTFDASFELFLIRDPFEVSSDAALVRVLQDAATEVLQRKPRMIGENPWMDSALTAAAGIETVVFGPAGQGAHAEEEWVDLKSVEQLAQVLVRTALDYCGTN